MDHLNSTGKDLQLIPRGKDDRPSPSRLREANHNLVLLLQLVKQIAAVSSIAVDFLVGSEFNP